MKNMRKTIFAAVVLMFILWALPNAEAVENGFFADNQYYTTHDGITKFQCNKEVQGVGCYYTGTNSNKPVKILGDFTARISVKFDGGEKRCSYGMQIRCTTKNGDESIYFVMMSPLRGCIIMKHKGVILFQENRSSFRSSRFNELTVTFRQGSIFCYVNRKEFYRGKVDAYDTAIIGLITWAPLGATKCSFKDFNLIMDETTPSILSPAVPMTKLTFQDTKYFINKNGITSFDGGEEGYFSWISSKPIAADFTARVMVRWDGGKTDKGYGMVFRITDDPKSFYVFAIKSNGFYALEKYVNDKWKYPVKWRETNLVKPGFNELAVTCREATIICCLNGKQVIKVRDDSPCSAQMKIGIGSNGGTKCSFKDFEFCEADPNVTN